jgi:YHS domain-containing protein
MGGLLRLLLLAIALWLIISSLRRLFLLLAFSRRDKEEEKEQKELPLVQDLQCGRFVLERDAISTSFHGQELYFCSQECRDLYRRSQITKEQEKR